VSTPPLRVYPTSTCLPHLYVSTPPLRVYPTSTCLPHLYVSTPPLFVYPTYMCLPHLYVFMKLHVSIPHPYVYSIYTCLLYVRVCACACVCVCLCHTNRNHEYRRIFSRMFSTSKTQFNVKSDNFRLYSIFVECISVINRLYSRRSPFLTNFINFFLCSTLTTVKFSGLIGILISMGIIKYFPVACLSTFLISNSISF